MIISGRDFLEDGDQETHHVERTIAYMKGLHFERNEDAPSFEEDVNRIAGLYGFGPAGPPAKDSKIPWMPDDYRERKLEEWNAREMGWDEDCGTHDKAIQAQVD